MRTRKKSRKADESAARLRRIIAILHKWGIHTLGDFARLDKEKITARLGPEVIPLWERANGQSTRLLKWIQPPESFAESFEFESEVETIEPLLFILRRFLEHLARRLHAVYLVAGKLTLRLSFTNKRSYQYCFKIPQPTNNVDLLFRMLHAHLEDFTSEYPMVAVFLEAEPAPSAHQQFGLFETALRDPNQLFETLARLTGLFGAERVGTPVLEETHRPDAFRMEPFSWQVGMIDLDGPEGKEPGPGLALRQFRPEISASVLLDENNRPVHLRSGEIAGPVRAQGPYVASGNWWDDQRWSRKEWDLHLCPGAVFRCHENPDGWQADGIYD